AVEPEIVEAPPVGVDDIEDAEVIAETPAEDTDENPPVSLSPEEQELQALYSEDVAQPGIAHAEYKDRQTADEDRPMTPEINARDERKAQWQDRRDRRRSRREDRERQRDERRDQRRAQPPQQGQAQPQGQQQPQQPRPPQNQHSQPQTYRPVQPPVQINGTEEEGVSRVGTVLGDAAATVFAQLRNGQPLPVRQLAAMMRKRSLVETDPEQLAPQLKAELLGDERSYRTLGLRPRIVYRGRDLFAPGPVSMSQTADAEAGVATALSRLAGATHRALGERISKASPAGFERLIHAYLVAFGYRDIAWVKRLGGISYASATAPGIDRTVLISARSGDEPIDRRGIGELRVGVEAKNLVAGILFSARELSEDAERELERPGRSISVMCGDQLVAALIAGGVGVVSSAAPLHYVDDQLLDELLAG
nr:restriction endonuclease [Deltaproteobacteria bacterium]